MSKLTKLSHTDKRMLYKAFQAGYDKGFVVGRSSMSSVQGMPNFEQWLHTVESELVSLRLKAKEGE